MCDLRLQHERHVGEALGAAGDDDVGLPAAMWSAAFVIATHADAQAMPTVKAGIRGGIASASTISRARLW